MSNSVSIGCIITHPSLDPNSITQNVNLKPTLTQKGGNQVTTPSHPVENSFYKFSKWQYIKELSYDDDLKIELQMLVDHLFSSVEFLNKVTSEGGSIEIFFRLTNPAHRAMMVDSNLMKKIGEINASFGFEEFE